MSVRRGEIYYADLSPVFGSEQGGVRPVVVIQNEIGNLYSPTVIVAAITSKFDKARLPTHVPLRANRHGLTQNSIIMLEQIRTLDKTRLQRRVGHVGEETLDQIDDGIAVSLGLRKEG